MNIRWSVIVLVILGVAAAGAAALFTASLSAQQIGDMTQLRAPDVEILVAKNDLATGTTVRAEHFDTKSVSRTDAPDGFYSEPTQVVGKVLTVPVVEGQALTKAVFPKEGSGAQLASMLPAGKRAVNISLSDYEGLEGLLYPGSVVDVLAYFKLDKSDHIGDAVSTTLLQNVEVLAVENLTVGSNANGKEAAKRSNSSSTKRALVTLLVDSQQAEALQLAMKYGAVSLAMRNPTDNEELDTQATLLHGGPLALLSEYLLPAVNPETRARLALATDKNPNLPLTQFDGSRETAPEVSKAVAPKQEPKESLSPSHTLRVFRGSAVQEYEFPLSQQ